MRISDWSSDVCSSDLQRVRCLVAAVNGIALRRAGEIDDGDREREFAFRTAEPLESVPAVETQTLRSRIGQTDVLERHARAAPCEIRRIDAAVEHACKPVQRRLRLAAAPGFMQIGRASCRERVCQYVSLSVVAVAIQKKKYTKQQHT